MKSFIASALAWCVLGMFTGVVHGEPASAGNGDSPAHRAAKHFRRGANFGNYLEAGKQGWAIPHTVADLRAVKAEGFDHVRLPVAWQAWAGPGPAFELSPEIFAKVDVMVTNATSLGLNLILNIHHFDALTSDPASNRAEFLAIWRQVAAHYQDAPEGIAFELLNEPKDAATTEVMNPIYADAIREIRKTNPKRTLFVGPGRWNSAGELKNLQLPADDRNLIVTVHCYDPFLFTHQGATWSGPDPRTTGVIFPGPPKTPLEVATNSETKPWVLDWFNRYNTLPTDQNPSSPLAFRGTIEKAKAWGEEQGRPMHVGEFGCFTKADKESRARFYRAIRQEIESAGMGWAVWDWKAGFRYWDDKAKQPIAGMREALFGKE